MLLTVALPTWNNRNIIWLPMEGLARQQTRQEWELIVMECFSPDMIGEAYFRGYEARLRDAGCVGIKYIYSDTRLPLSAKWRQMGKVAKGEYFLLQGSDDYPHPERIEQTSRCKDDWYDMRYYYHFDIGVQKLILFDSYCKDPKTGEMYSMAGECMAIRTKLLKNLPDRDMSSSVDHFLMRNTGVKTRHIEPGVYAGISTTGLNTISISRRLYFVNVIEPFYPTTETIDTIGLPVEVVHKLKRYA